MGATPAAGTTLAISAGTPATFDEAGYDALSWTTVGEVTTIPEYGRVYTEITHTPLDTRGTKIFKGSFRNGTPSIPLAMDDDNAGQNLMDAALLSDDDYSFRITYPTGDIRYFQAKVMSFPETPGGPDNILMRNANLAITTADDGTGIVRVAA